MSKKMTPCEKLGYKVGDKFEVIEDSAYFKKGEIVSLRAADNSSCPFFTNEKVVRDGYSKGCAMYLSSVKKISKLKPAKQALADAIHQNGGWADGAEWCAISSADMKGSFWNAKDSWLSRENGIWCGYGYTYGRCFSVDRLPVNHHQTIISRDEYLTAYPEQVKVEVKNETNHKVEVEMESESEVTIRVSDWHKNGELPPVGEVCIFDPTGGECYFNDDELKAKGHQVCIIAHTKYKQSSGSVAVFKWDLDECSGVSSANACSFRPIRTEREKAIDEMVSLVEPLATYREFAGAIYDAGMYK